jgi:hypothetical protein
LIFNVQSTGSVFDRLTDLPDQRELARNAKVSGLARIVPDVSVALALATIESVSVLGAFHATRAVKAALADRIH